MSHNSHNLATFLYPETIDGARKSFILAKKAENRKPYTLRVYQLHINALDDFLSEYDITNMQDVRPDHIREFIVDLQEEHNEGGVHSYYRSIKAFFRWYWDEYEIEKANPITRVKLSPPPVVPKPGIPMANFFELVNACKGAYADRDRAIMNCLLDSGCRAGEFARLNIEDVDLHTGKVYLWYTKSRRSRAVAFADQARRYLRRYLKTRIGTARMTDPLFLTDDEKRFTTNGLYQLIERRANNARIPVPGLHDFRRRCGAQMRHNGADIRTIQAYLGHSSPVVTERYLALEGDEVTENHHQYSPVDNATREQ